ncbi:MAG: DNA polymerase I [Actinobacteria bacterium]|nr:DNA polymerase I [Actinomycetota bacterium]
MADKIVIIDGNSLAYRAYYALPATIVTSKGAQINSVYGFVSMLLKVLSEEKPSGVAVAFDSAAPTFRHDLFDEYKSNRPGMPDELVVQMGVLEDLLKKMKIPVFKADGYEADDIIGTIAKRMADSGYDVLLITSDKDALQLVNDRIKVMANRKGISDVIMYDKNAVYEKFGVWPGQIADYLGLVGDKSDNIPGVAGIGEKTAAELIEKFGDFDGVFKNVNQLRQEKVRKILLENGKQAAMSRELSTLNLDVPLDFRVDDLLLKPVDADAVRDAFLELEFKTLVSRIPDWFVRKSAETPIETRLHSKDNLIDHLSRLDEVSDEISGSKYISILATVLEDSDGKLLVREFNMSTANESYFISDRLLGRDFLEELLNSSSKIFGSPAEKIFFDLKPFMKLLLENKIELRGRLFDLAIADYLLRPMIASRSLKEVQDIYLGRSGIDLGSSTFHELKNILEAKLDEFEMRKLFEEIEMPLVRVLAQMELDGVAVDREYLADLVDIYEVRINELCNDIYGMADQYFNVNSPQQLGKVLFDKLKIAKPRKTKTGYATGRAVLDELIGVHPIIEKIIEYRECSKLKNTYIDALPKYISKKDGRVHTSYNQMATATGRLSSSDPNIQNIPIKTELGREIRKAFIAEKGNLLISADYSQIELRILAFLSGDKVLITAFKNGLDVHAITASEILGKSINNITPADRRLGKTINFGIIYGMSEHGLSQALAILREDARSYINSYFNHFPDVKRYLDGLVIFAKKNGYVTTIFGRRRPVAELTSTNQALYSFGERIAMNSPLQGSAADIIKIATVKLQRAISDEGLGAKIVLSVHDELVIETPEHEAERTMEVVKHEMEGACDLGEVGLRVDISTGNSWYI